jgi:hypothetical protein
VQPPSPAARGGAAARDDPAGAELAALGDEVAATERAWRAVAGALSPAQFNWRAAPGRWSVGEHLAHLNLVDASYLPHLDRMLARGRAAGLVARGVPRHPWLGRRFIAAVEPPVTLKVRTTTHYVPPSTVDRDAALAEFAGVRRALRERIAAAAGLDPGRVRAVRRRDRTGQAGRPQLRAVARAHHGPRPPAPLAGGEGAGRGASG